MRNTFISNLFLAFLLLLVSAGYTQERLPIRASQEDVRVVTEKSNALSEALKVSPRNAIVSAEGITILAPGTDIRVNDNIGSTGTSGFTQSETTILAFGNNIVVGFNDAGSFNTGGNKFTGWSYSADGGATFTDGGTLPTNPLGDAGDPVLARNATTGRIYYSTLGFNSPGTIQMFRSDNNGVSWMAPVNATPGGSSEDKQWHTVDNFAGPGNGNVYLLSRRFGAGPGIYFFRSTDHGATFGSSGGTLIVAGSQGAFIAVGPDHSIYAFWFAGMTLQVRKSTDFGTTFGAPVTVASGLLGGVNGDLGLTGIRQGTVSPAAFRSNEFPHVDINPVSGHIYVTYDNDGPGADKADVFLVMSTNGGATWSAPVKVNDDATTTDQWMPTIAVSPDGLNLGVFYYSRQEDPGNNLFRYQGRLATISGATVTFSPSFAISDVQSLPEFGRDAVVNPVYMGDYNQAVFSGSAFHVVWSDNRDDLAGGAPRKDPNVYYDRIPVVTDVPPTISCPDNITVNNAPGLCSQSVSFTVTATGTPPPTVVCRIGATVIHSPHTFPVGTTTVTCTATNSAGSASCSFTVTVNDVEPPGINDLNATPNVLWPPNHKMRDITVNYTSKDNCPGPGSCQLSVSSNEPVEGDGDGNTSPDWKIVDDHHVKLRAERSGNGNGRIYTITVTCTDQSGNKTSSQTIVTVPKNMSSSANVQGNTVIESRIESLTFKATPSPTRNYFTLNIQTNSSDHINVRLFDITGRVVESRNNLMGDQVISIGRNLKSGIYVVQLRQGKETKQMKLVKIE